MLLKVKVTEHHIKNGQRTICSKCPVALALMDVLNVSSLGVVCSYAHIVGMDGKRTHNIRFNTETANFINSFDAAQPVEPFEFEIDVPEDFVRTFTNGESVIVRIFDIVGGPICVSAGDGQRVYDKIAPLLRNGTPVVLSFEQVETLIAAFLNAAIGQLYDKFPEDRIRELVSVRDMNKEDTTLLKVVVENAKKYFKAPQTFDQVWKEEADDEE